MFATVSDLHKLDMGYVIVPKCPVLGVKRKTYARSRAFPLFMRLPDYDLGDL
jgi:hypothetical protein